MSTVKATTLSNLAGDRTISTDRVAQGTAAAWVNFNGTGTVAIRAAYNVSSITDNGVGDYTVNFTTALADANYAVSGQAANPGTNAAIVSGPTLSVANQTATSFRANTVNAGATGPGDQPVVHLVFFR